MSWSYCRVNSDLRAGNGCVPSVSRQLPHSTTLPGQSSRSMLVLQYRLLRYVAAPAGISNTACSIIICTVENKSAE